MGYLDDENQRGTKASVSIERFAPNRSMTVVETSETQKRRVEIFRRGVLPQSAKKSARGRSLTPDAAGAVSLLAATRSPL